MAIKCLRFCANILRLHNSGLLCISPHYICSDNVCYVRCIEELVQYLKLFWDEFLNTMVLRAKQQEDKCWWLHSFYGLWLQTLVHRTIYSLRKEFGLPFENTWNHYHLALRLFAAASGGHSSYDPLVTSWSLDDLHDKPSTELSQMRFYYLAQKAFDTRQWKTSGIHSSYDYLARMIPSTPLESRTQQDKVMDEERKQEKTMFSSQQHSKPTSTRPREGSVRGARRPRLFTLDDDSDDEDLYCQEPLPRKNIDLPHSALSRARNRGAKRRANSPPIYTTGGGLSESGSAMTRSSLSIGMSPTFASYSADIGSGSPLRINTPTSIRSMHSLPRSPMIPDRSSYSSSTGFTGMNGTPLPYVSSHESLSTGLQSTSIASSNSWAIKFHMCSCCPKKPKKFETKEELRLVYLSQRADDIFYGSLSRRYISLMHFAGLMRPKSSMSVVSAGTVSSLRTRLSATRTAFTCVDIAGRVQRSTWVASTVPFMTVPVIRGKLMSVVTVGMSLCAVEELVVVSDNPPSRTGTKDYAIYKKPIGFESATQVRSSTAQTISASTSNIAMRVPLGSGLICWRMRACWRRNPRSRRIYAVPRM